MLKAKIHYDTKIEDEDFTFICRAGCLTDKALQAANEVVTYLIGVKKQQDDAAQAAKEKAEVEEPKEG